MAYIGWGVYVMSRVDGDPVKQKAAWSAAAHLGGKDLSLWSAAYPSGFQPYRHSHFDIAEWVAAGYDEAFTTSYLNSEADSSTIRMRQSNRAFPVFSSITASPRMSCRRSGPVARMRREGADTIAAAGRKSPTALAATSRSNSIRPRSAKSADVQRKLQNRNWWLTCHQLYF